MTTTGAEAHNLQAMIADLLRHVRLQDLAQIADVSETVLRQWSGGEADPTARQHRALYALAEVLPVLRGVGLNAQQVRDWLFDGRPMTLGGLAPAHALATDPYRVLAAVHELAPADDAPARVVRAPLLLSRFVHAPPSDAQAILQRR